MTKYDKRGGAQKGDFSVIYLLYGPWNVENISNYETIIKSNDIKNESVYQDQGCESCKHFREWSP